MGGIVRAHPRIRNPQIRPRYLPFYYIIPTLVVLWVHSSGVDRSKSSVLLVIGWCGTRRLLLSINDTWESQGGKIYGTKKGVMSRKAINDSPVLRTRRFRLTILPQSAVQKRDTANLVLYLEFGWDLVRAQPSVISHAYLGISPHGNLGT